MFSVFNAGRKAAMAVVVAAAAFTQPAAAEPFRMIITEPNTPLVPNSVMELALQEGYFEREGVEVEFIRVSDTTAAAAALIAGEGDMANISLPSALGLAAQSLLPFKGVTVPDKYLPFLVAARTATVPNVAALAGKSYGVANVGSLDYSLSQRVFQANGIDPAAVNYVSVGAPAQRGTALIAGQIDATTMSIGIFLGLPDRTGIDILVPVDEFQEAAAILNKINIVRDEVLETRRDDVVGFVRALVKIARDYNENPSLWVDAMAKARPDYSRDNLVILAEQFQGTFSGNGGMDRAVIEAGVAEAYKSPDLAGLPMVEMAKWVDFSIVDDILAELGTVDGSDPAGR